MIIRLYRRLSTYTPVCIDYSELATSSDLSKQINSALGKEGLGIIAVKNIPDYLEMRKNILRSGRALALLSNEQKESIIVRGANYPIGWRCGTDHYQGISNISQASFFANPEVDFPQTEWPPNVWPHNSLPNLEREFKLFGSKLIQVSSLLAKHLDIYISSLVKDYIPGTLYDIITNQRCQVGRLIHYFPQKESTQY